MEIFPLSKEEELKQEPPLYFIKCTDTESGLYQYSIGQDEREQLINVIFTSFAGMDYQEQNKKILANTRNLREGYQEEIIEYDLTSKSYKVLWNRDDIKRILGEIVRNAYSVELCFLRYLPNSDDISFIYGEWGNEETVGTLYIYRRGSGIFDSVCEVNPLAGYQWTQDGTGLYYTKSGILYRKELKSGKDEKIMEDVSRFKVSSHEDIIAVWQKNQDDYTLYLYNKTLDKRTEVSISNWMGDLVFSQENKYIGFIEYESGILGELLNGERPILCIYDIKRAQIVKKVRGNYGEVWGGIVW